MGQPRGGRRNPRTREVLGVAFTGIFLLLASAAISGEGGIQGLTGTLWVTDEWENAVVKIEAATGKVLAVIPVGKKPVAVSAPKGTGKIYVSDESDNMVSVIDKATGTVTKKISVGLKPHHMHRSPNGKFVYVGLFGTNRVAVISTANDKLVAEYVTGPPGARTHAPWASSDGKTVWVANSTVNEVAKLDVVTGKILRTIKVRRSPSEVLITKDGKIAYVSVGPNALQVIDLSSNTIIREIEVGTMPDTLSLTRNAAIMFIGLRGAAAAAVVDTRSLTVKQINLLGITTGHNAVSDDGRFAFIAVVGPPDSGVAVVDLQNLSVAAFYAYPGSGQPHGLIFEPSDDGDNTAD